MSFNHVIKASFPDIPGAFMLMSVRKKDKSGTSEQDNLSFPVVSFLFVGETHAAEWEVNYGPILIHIKGVETDMPHYAFPFVKDNPLGWSQMAVNREELPAALLSGSYRYIFEVLKEWIESREA